MHRAAARTDPDQALALAIVTTSTVPLLLLDRQMRVIAASASFCEGFDIEGADSVGTEMLSLGDGEWNDARLRSLLSATVGHGEPIFAYEMDFVIPGHDRRSLILNARRLDYGDTVPLRVLLKVTDVTGARMDEKAKNDLIREKGILLQEMHHRVANSLQIISSVLVQSARRVQSPETRGHLHDASNRVMSVSALQRELATSAVGDVELRSYFTRLCDSIGASMIHDPAQLVLQVTGDASTVKSDMSVSLGLIVTELTINALKHAFPDHRGGRICVDFRRTGGGWTLTVEDDGVGMPANLDRAKAGLGTSIVEALARQLDAGIDVADNDPGTTIRIACSKKAGAGREVHRAI